MSQNNKAIKGFEILRNPATNKGTAFTEAERDALGLRGLLPPQVNTMPQQVARVMENFRRKPTNLEKYIHLINLQLRNEVLFYRFIIQNIDEMMRIIYTPTVGLACQQYGQIFQKSMGLFITIKDRGNIVNILKNWYKDSARIIVVTDGERILGLGDLGANGMGIPVGKLSLYTVCAGINPNLCLPITLDVGTNNESLIHDPLYIGLRQPRVQGQEYDDFIEEFITAANEIFPDCLIQFEDFANHNAFRLLDRYKDEICTFNDDIQGTGSVALAGLYSAMRVKKQNLSDQTILFLGAGEAGLGIGDMVVAAMAAEGTSIEDAQKKCWFVDSKGLIVKSRSNLNKHKLLYAHDQEPANSLINAIHLLKPQVIVGVSGRKNMFDQEVLEAMAKYNEKPIIFALSNPTSNSECTADEAYIHTQGRAIFASGSPFDPVTFEGKYFVPGQGNNAYIFPGVGLGVLVSKARRITNEMFFAAAKTLALQVSTNDLEHGTLYPPLKDIRKVSTTIAKSVIEIAIQQGHTDISMDNIEIKINKMVYEPCYKECTTAE